MSEDRIHDLVDQMTLAEQVSLLSGEDFWSLPAISRLGIHKLRVTDGPNGARGGGGLIGGVKSAAFPVGIAIGASWNPALAHDIGSALADEVKSKGAHVSLSPTVNIHRSVTNGRNFECYAEDPVLTGKLAVGFITGLQEQGISATIKHFVGNESEIERTTMSSQIDERTMREVYLVPFEQAVKVAGTWGIMSSYNRLNGTYTSENHWLLTKVLREQWNYTGVVMSDWFGSHSTAPTVTAGLDMEMPGPPRDRGQKLVDAVEAGEVSRDVVRERVLNVLRLAVRTGAIDDDRVWTEHADDRPAHRALIRRAGVEGAILLKNTGLLPLDAAAVGKIAVIGPNAKSAQIMGGGSAQLNPHYMVSPWDGLLAAVGADRLSYAEGARNNRFEPRFDGPYAVDYFNSNDLSGPVVHKGTEALGEMFLVGALGDGKVDMSSWSARFTATFTPEVSGEYRIGLVSVGYARAKVDGKLVTDAWGDKWAPGRTYFEEGNDEVVGTIRLDAGRAYTIEIEFGKKPARMLDFSALRIGIGLPLGDDAIAEAVRAAKAADVAVVCIGRSGEWDTEGSDLENIKLPGRQDELVAAVAAANPRTIVVLQTGGPVEMPWLNKVAAVLEAWYPGQEAGSAIADVLTGTEPGGRLPQSFPVRWNDNPVHSQDREIYPGLNGKVRYEEGVFIGYRHYDRQGITPLFPFGFGLSYTSFELAELAIDEAAFEQDGKVVVSAKVTNTGKRRGSTVVQLYIGDEQAAVPRPIKELKAFDKLWLDAGESKRMRFELSGRDFTWFDVDAQNWVAEPGTFTLLLGFSATDIRLSGVVRRTSELRLPV